MLMELTILANIGQIRQSKISLADFVDFDAFPHFRYGRHFWTYPKAYR